MKKIRVFNLPDGRIVESREELIKQQKEIEKLFRIIVASMNQ